MLETENEKGKQNLQLIKTYLDYLSNVRLYSENTIEAYRNDLMQFSDFLRTQWKIDLLSVQLYHIQSFISELTLKKRESVSVARMISSIKTFYRFLYKKGMTNENPSAALNMNKKEKKIPGFFTYKEVQDFLDFLYSGTDPFSDRDCAIFELLVGSGLRVSELVNLKHQDLNIDKKIVKVKGKGDKERIVPISDPFIKAYQNLVRTIQPLNFYTPVFLNRNNKKLTRQGVFYILRKRMLAYGNKNRIFPHKLRHTFATLLLENGADIRFVQTLLGHSSLASTEVYTHLNIEKKKTMYKKFHPHR